MMSDASSRMEGVTMSDVTATVLIVDDDISRCPNHSSC
jgi:hypothetical protein